MGRNDARTARALLSHYQLDKIQLFNVSLPPTILAIYDGLVAEKRRRYYRPFCTLSSRSFLPLQSRIAFAILTARVSAGIVAGPWKAALYLIFPFTLLLSRYILLTHEQ